jgi:poly [ADP-ribose] polymerase 2/3/4
LESNSTEYQRINEKVRSTSSTHHNVSLQVNNIFEIEIEIGSTNGRFNPKNLSASELFHGSANKNILGILERGLLIAPPYAQFTGAAFGRGIYFASNSTKSAQYSTKFVSNIHHNGFLFLADVALGRMQKVSNFTFNDHGPSRGYDSVMGIKGADLIHDEYIVYNVNQVELRYVIDFTPKAKGGYW